MAQRITPEAALVVAAVAVFVVWYNRGKFAPSKGIGGVA